LIIPFDGITMHGQSQRDFALAAADLFVTSLTRVFNALYASMGVKHCQNYDQLV
jgi:hypothetical protein